MSVYQKIERAVEIAAVRYTYPIAAVFVFALAFGVTAVALS